MIPKKIHYCWFGKGQKNELVKRCINSWKVMCPEYEIIEWNESNCDIKSNLFAEEAYKNRKWAFVSDYFRLKVLFENGGIYLDTDVELLNNLDKFLNDRAFFGYADDTYIGTGLFGCEKHNELCKLLLAYYQNRHFCLRGNHFNIIPNNEIFTALFIKNGFDFGNSTFSIGEAKIYPSVYFSPFKIKTFGNVDQLYNLNNYRITNNTYAIHYTVYSWGDKMQINQRLKHYFINFLRRFMPLKVYFYIKRYIKHQKLNKFIKNL